MGSRRKSKKGMKTYKRRKRRTSNVKKGGAKPQECVLASVFFRKGFECPEILSINELEKIRDLVGMVSKEKIQKSLTKIRQGDISILCDEFDVKKVGKTLEDVSHEVIKLKFGNFEENRAVTLLKSPFQLTQAIEDKDGGQVGGAGARQRRRVDDEEWLRGAEGRQEMQAIVQRMPDFRANENNEGWRERAFNLVCEIYAVLLAAGFGAIFGGMFGRIMGVISGLGAGAYVAYQIVTGQL